MAKPIKLTEEIKQKCLEEFQKNLDEARLSLGEFQFKKSLKYESEKTCEVCYSAIAWYKTIMLIENQPKEVGWHGVCRRDVEDPTVFYVDDIFVYPQRVTGATIDPDPIEYTAWMNGLDDQTFNNLRCHVHSHVNMGVTPSGTDQTFRADRLSQLSDDGYYIFQIMNKKGDISSAVYDFKNNIFYESGDVKTTVICDCEMEEWDTYKTIGKLLMACTGDELTPIVDLFHDSGMKSFLNGAKEYVKEAIPAYSGYGDFWSRRNQMAKNTTNGSKYRGNNYTALPVYNSQKDKEKKSDLDKKLSDPMGYTDEMGVFHGSAFDDDDDDGFYGCTGLCDRCKNMACTYNDNYYDVYAWPQ